MSGLVDGGIDSVIDNPPGMGIESRALIAPGET